MKMDFVKRFCAHFVALWVVLFAAGCGHARPVSGGDGAPVDVAPLARKSHPAADLTQPFNAMAWNNNGARRDPLSVAAQLAASAGGDWLAVLLKPADDVKWQPQFPIGYPGIMMSDGGRDGRPDMSVNACLKQIRAQGAPLVCEIKDGRALLFFGTSDDLAHVRVHPPQQLAGLRVSAHSAVGLLAMLGDFLQLQLRADPALLQRRDEILAARRTDSDANEPRGVLSSLSGLWRGMGGGIARPPVSDMLIFEVAERVAVDALMQRVAAYLGGRCRRVEGGWEFLPHNDTTRVQQEIARLTAIVDEKSGTAFVHATPNPITGESIVVIGALSDEAQSAIENLAALGAPAIPKLAGYLNPEQAAIARCAVRVLLALSLPEARRAVLDFARRLQSGPVLKGKAAEAAPLLEGEIVQALAHNADREACAWLAGAAKDARVSGDLRRAARMALIQNGAFALLAGSTEARRQAPFMSFTLSVRPDGSASPSLSPGAIVPLATCRAGDGMTWAVFLSGRCGDPFDFWLARGRGEKWEEFLYTGRSFPRASLGYNPFSVHLPGPGCLALRIAGDRVILDPPASSGIEKTMEQLRRALGNPKLAARQRAQVISQLRIGMMTQRNIGRLQEQLTFKLADMRRDTDHDGLPDAVKARLGTQLRTSDTGDDADAGDPSPPAGSVAGPSVRQRLIQAVFTALFSGDPNPDPIIAVLDRPYWQRFYGTGAPVLCMTRAEFLKRCNRLSGLRVLQFGGPSDPASTILNLDGPCAFNETHTRAEIHFWQWSPRQAVTQPWMLLYGGDARSMPADYVATFSRRGTAWRLDTIRPWKVDTADTAMGDYMRRAMENGGN